MDPDPIKELIQNAGTIPAIAEVTGRNPVDVLSDALNTYIWILHEQAAEKKIISTTRETADDEEVTELVNLVLNKEALLRYSVEGGPLYQSGCEDQTTE